MVREGLDVVRTILKTLSDAIGIPPVSSSDRMLIAPHKELERSLRHHMEAPSHPPSSRRPLCPSLFYVQSITAAVCFVSMFMQHRIPGLGFYKQFGKDLWQWE